MSTFAHSVYLDSEFGVPQELQRAGSSLENPYAFDATARDLKAMAQEGLIEILDEHVSAEGGDAVIDHLRFVRLR